MRKLILVGAALGVLCSGKVARAVVLLSDSFNYTNGPLITVSGGTWVRHSGGTGEVQVVSGRALYSQTNSEDVNVLLSGQPYGATTNVRLYASFTVNFASLPSGGGTYFVHFKDSGATGFRDKIFATTNGVAAGFFRVGVASFSNSPTVLIASNLSLNADYTLVTRYAPSNASSVLWLNPSAENDPSVTATDIVSTLSISSFALRESFSSPDGMGTLFLDNLIVGTSFSDVISNSAGGPIITNQPQGQTVTEGNNVMFTVGASGTPPLYYQWQWYSTNLPGATNASLALNNVTTNQAGPYSVTVTNVAGSTNSQTATLTVNSSNSAPIITAQPQNQSVAQGGAATFTVAATGAQPLSYQWQFYGTNLDGATNASLVLSGVTTNQAGPYVVTVTNSAGSTNSQTATLTVAVPPAIAAQPQSQTATEGNTVIFTVGATGTSPLSYQWQFSNTNLAGATDSTLTLSSVTTNQGGPYTVVITNAVGSTSSAPATLTVNPLPAQVPALSYVTYNMKGNGATNFTTNGPQLQALGRELAYLSPDVITFNEIQHSSLSDMTNFVRTYLPGYNLVISPSSDNFIQNGIASRFPITFFKSFLHSTDLAPYGYTNSDFTRDLFQARVTVPGFARPMNVFVVHLKSGQDSDSSSKRGAEASAVSNWFVTVFLPTNSLEPYTLSGDMNEDINNPPSPTDPQSIQRLANAATGLQLTTPLNPVTHSELTFSIQSGSGLTKRYDYIMPCGLLFSNITSSQVFRTDLLTNPPPPLLTNDDKTASDHLPVQMVFGNPYNKAFLLTSITRSNLNVTLKWQSVLGQPYRLETSSNFGSWSVFASNLVATGATYTFSTNLGDSVKFFRVYRVP